MIEMKKPTKQTQEFIKTNFPFIKIRKNEVKFKATESVTYEIPSDIYPLRNKNTAEIFSYANTEQLKDEPNIAQIFDSITLKTGFCYTNTENFKEALLKAGIKDKDVKTYTGWIFLNGLPVHHCWLVYKDKHVFDAGVSRIDEAFKITMSENPNASMDEARLIYKKIHDAFQEQPNSKIYTCGHVAPFALYVGSETTPNQGRVIYHELIKKYPDHPSYQAEGMNANGRSKLQEMLNN